MMYMSFGSGQFWSRVDNTISSHNHILYGNLLIIGPNSSACSQIINVDIDIEIET